ncbi:unnamed protein product, partial [Polarella glacialis]
MGISLETSDVLAERRHRSASSADTAGSETNSEEVCAENSQGQTCKRTQARWADLSEEDAHWAELSGEEDELSTQDSLDRVEYPKKHCQDRTTEKLGDSHQSSPVPVERAGERRPARDTREARRSSESLRWSVKGSPLADAADAEVPARPRRSAHTQQSEWEGSKWGSQSWEGGWSKSSRNKSSWEHSSWPDKAGHEVVGAEDVASTGACRAGSLLELGMGTGKVELAPSRWALADAALRRLAEVKSQVGCRVVCYAPLHGMVEPCRLAPVRLPPGATDTSALLGDGQGGLALAASWKPHGHGFAFYELAETADAAAESWEQSGAEEGARIVVDTTGCPSRGRRMKYTDDAFCDPEGDYAWKQGDKVLVGYSWLPFPDLGEPGDGPEGGIDGVMWMSAFIVKVADDQFVTVCYDDDGTVEDCVHPERIRHFGARRDRVANSSGW